ncbi:hypothetical protein VTL71DRAFT_6519 [Oculimacula yallundae]|uniref:Uncharacterized protein n=1 Tax=Oculimacula yallundae TaxID=86028 RepID=A0ABR4BX93_9HELO
MRRLTDKGPAVNGGLAILKATHLYGSIQALAERTMWDWVSDKGPKFDMVSINPNAIFGPHVVGPNGEGSPTLAHLNVLTTMSPALYALLAAVQIPEAGGERFLAAKRTHCQFVREAARRAVPELASRVEEGEVGDGERANDTTYDVNGRKLETILGIHHTTLDDTMKDACWQLLEIEAH